jgi:hypothetical protein
MGGKFINGRENAIGFSDMLYLLILGQKLHRKNVGGD